MVVHRTSVRKCRRGHEITPDNETTDGKCKRCARERVRAWRAGEKREPVAPVEQCVNGHDYDDENTYWYRGQRQCKACRRVRIKESFDRHREERLAGQKAWRDANAERHRESARRWLRENPERANLTSRLKKQRRRAAGTLTVEDWELVLDVYGRNCLACGKPEVTIDHVVPVSAGGLNVVSNVQPLCGRCNTSKGTKTIDYRPVPWEDIASQAV
jgi:5-methylcytosine-specific restriction endonuclease McrA